MILPTPGGASSTASMFASDALTFGGRVTMTAGLRFDRGLAISQDLKDLDAEGRDTGRIVSGLGTLYTSNVLSPRLGVTAKLTANGRTILRGSYGRFNQGVLTGELSPIHPGIAPMTTADFDPITGGYTSNLTVVDSKRTDLPTCPRRRARRSRRRASRGSGRTVR